MDICTRRAAASLFLAAGLGAQPRDLAVAPGPPIRLMVAKTGLMSGKVHVFEFPAWRAALRYDESAPAASRVEIVIDAARCEVKDAWLSEADSRKVLDFARGRMLASDRFPEIRFASRSVEVKTPGELAVRGELTIRDRTRPVELAVKAETDQGWLQWTGTALVDMREYGLEPPKAALGTIGTDPKMRVEFRVRAAR